ncbi:rhodanese-like domain-containing protein [Thermodesulfobacteriota bacterium]
MKRIFIGFLAMAVIVCLQAPIIADSDTFFPEGLEEEVNTAEKLKNIIDNGDPRFVIVDIRSQASYRMGHIPTAICIPMEKLQKWRIPQQKKNISFFIATVADQHMLQG